MTTLKIMINDLKKMVADEKFQIKIESGRLAKNRYMSELKLFKKYLFRLLVNDCIYSHDCIDIHNDYYRVYAFESKLIMQVKNTYGEEIELDYNIIKCYDALLDLYNLLTA